MKFETVSTEIRTVFGLELTLATLVLYSIVVFEFYMLLQV